MRNAVVVFLVVRILASVTAVIAIGAVPSNPIAAANGYAKPAYAESFELLFGVWERSDALWYLQIAQKGYGENRQGAAFLPLYPLAIRGMKLLTGLPWLVSALVVSNLAFLCALILLFKLTATETNGEVASRTVWYLALFPGSVFFLAPYTESLFLALATGSFLAARKRKWLLAAVLGSLLGTTRNIGVFILLPLALEFLRQRKEVPPVPPKKAFWLPLVPVGLMLVLLFWRMKTGDPLSLVHQQKMWGRDFFWPWITVWQGTRQALDVMALFSGGLYLAEAVAALGAILLGLMAIRGLPAPYVVFLWVCLLPPLLAPFEGRMLMCSLRFISVIFPVFMTLAINIRHRDLDLGIKIIFAGLYGLFTALYVASLNFF